jgi:5-methyltetrahydrofolate corrinoid/iron sulfur protein methyltransferase
MIIVADNLRITLPSIQRAVEEMDPDPICGMVEDCVKAGAHSIDINSGPLSKGAEEKMTFLVNTVQSVCDLPLVLDTTNPDAMAAGLSTCRNRAIMNGVSLEKHKLEKMLPLAVEHKVDVIAYLLNADSHVPADAAGRMEVAVALFDLLQQAGIPSDRIIIDPVVAPLVWQDGNRQNMDVMEVIRTLPDLLGEKVKTIAGLSNLTSGAPDAEKRHRYQAAFLPMLAAAGLDIVLMNAMDPAIMRLAATCGTLVEESIFSWV